MKTKPPVVHNYDWSDLRMMMWSNAGTRNQTKSRLIQLRQNEYNKAILMNNIETMIIEHLKKGTEPDDAIDAIWYSMKLNWARILRKHWERIFKHHIREDGDEERSMEEHSRNREYHYGLLLEIEWPEYYSVPKEKGESLSHIEGLYDGKVPHKAYKLNDEFIGYIHRGHSVFYVYTEKARMFITPDTSVETVFDTKEYPLREIAYWYKFPAILSKRFVKEFTNVDLRTHGQKTS